MTIPLGLAFVVSDHSQSPAVVMAGVTLAAFEHDRRKRWLIERGIEIVSEASRHLSAELKARHTLRFSLRIRRHAE